MHQLFAPPMSTGMRPPAMAGHPMMGGGALQMMAMMHMMGVMMEMMQTLMGMGRGGNMFSPMANFGGAPGMAGAPGLANFLGGGQGGQSAPAGGSSPASAGSAGIKNPVNMSRAQAEDLVRRGGGKVNPNGKPTVLALRSKTSASRTYQDTFIVLKPDGSMQQFEGNTRPSTSGRNRAMLKPGAYELSPRWRDGKYNNDAFLVKSKNGSMTVGVGRDTNGDGVYSQQEMNGGHTSSLIRFHRGRGNQTSSTGCLNCKDYDGFLKSVGGRDASFNLVLVNM